MVSQKPIVFDTSSRGSTQPVVLLDANGNPVVNSKTATAVTTTVPGDPTADHLMSGGLSASTGNTDTSFGTSTNNSGTAAATTATTAASSTNTGGSTASVTTTDNNPGTSTTTATSNSTINTVSTSTPAVTQNAASTTSTPTVQTVAPKLVQAAAAVNTYTVNINAPEGNGNYNTITKCANAVGAGGTCLVSGGTYTETLTPSTSGTAFSPITIKAATNPDGTTADVKIKGVNLDTVDYVQLEGLKFHSVSQWGISWTFSTYYAAGTFATDDFWVQAVNGAVTITATDPPSGSDFHGTYPPPVWVDKDGDGIKETPTCGAYTEGKLCGTTVTNLVRNGTMVNPDPATLNGHAQGFDSTIQHFADFHSDLNVAPGYTGKALSVTAGSTVVTAKSIDDGTIITNTSDPYLQTAAVLTVVSAPPPAGSFRPPMVNTASDRNQTPIYWNVNSLQYDGFLRSLDLPPDPDSTKSFPSLAWLEEQLEKPWLVLGENSSVLAMSPVDNMPKYGRDQSNVVAQALLYLQLKLDPDPLKNAALKKKLYSELVQYGIDVYGTVKAGMIYLGKGGNNAGHKAPMVFAGLALKDAGIQAWSNGANHPVFWEDQQTFFVSQADVNVPRTQISGRTCDIYTSWQYDYVTVPPTYYPNGIPEWDVEPYATGPTYAGSNWTSAYYRFIEGSQLGGKLAISLLEGGEAAWNWPAAFAYSDRFWKIESANGYSGQSPWSGTSSTGSNNIQPFVFAMMKAYSDANPPTPTGNKPVVTAPTPVSMDEDTANGVTGNILATDPDGDPLAFSAANGTNGIVTMNATNGAYTYKPNADAFGSDSFKVTVSDNHYNHVVVTVNVTINPVPDAPKAAPITTGVRTNTSQAITLKGSDADVVGDTSLTYAITQNPGHGTASIVGNVLTYTPATGYKGADFLLYQVKDSPPTGLLSNIARIDLTVSDIPPGQIYQDLTVHTFDGTNPLNLGGIGGGITTQMTVSVWVKRESIASNYSAVISDENYPGKAGYFLGNLSNSKDAKYCFRVNADSTACEASPIVGTEVWVNYVGVFDAGKVFLYKDGKLLASSTPSPQTKTSVTPDSGDAMLGGGVNEQFNGQIGNMMLFNTALSASDIQNFLFANPPVENTPPVATAQTLTFNEDTAQKITLSGTDLDNNPLSYTVVNYPAHGTLVHDPAFPTDPTKYVYTPDPNFNGPDSFTFKANDGTVDSAVGTVDLTIKAVNDVPTLDAIAPVMIDEDAGTQAVQLTGITAGGGETQALTVTATSSNAVLTGPVTVDAANVLRFTPVANAFGTATITVTVNDGQLQNNLTSQTFTVTVNAVNDAPTINAIAPVTIDEDAAQQTVNLAGITAGGSESQTLTVTAVSSDAALTGALTVNYTSPNTAGTLTLKPAANANGTATITVDVFDGIVHTPSSFLVTVNAVNDPPTVSDIANQSVAKGGVLGPISFTVGDIDTAVGTLTVTGTSSNTTLVPNANIVFSGTGANRTLTITPVATQSGTATITVTVSDGALSIPKTFVLTVPSGWQVPAGSAFQNTMDVVPPVSATNPTLTTGPDGSGAYHFDGNDFVTIPGADTFSATAVTLSAWVKLDAMPTENWGVMLGKQYGTGSVDSLFLAVSKAGKVGLGATTNTSFAQSSQALLTGQWYHIAGVIANGTLQIYINGVLAGSGKYSALQYDTNPITIGGQENGSTSTPSEYLKGSMDNVYVYARALTVPEIGQLAQLQPNQPPTINAITPVTINEDAAQQTVNFSGITAGVGENQPLVVTVVSSNPALTGALTVNYTSPNTAGTLTFKPALNANGSTTITVDVFDGIVHTPSSFLVTVNAVNDPPVLGSVAAQSVSSGSVVSFPLAATDVDTGDTRTYEIDGVTLSGAAISLPAGASLNVGTGAFSWTPTAAQVGAYVFRFKAKDAASVYSNIVSVNVTVTDGGTTIIPANPLLLDNLETSPSGTIPSGMTLPILSSDHVQGNYSYAFNGSNNVFNLGSADPASGSSLTVSVWVYRESASNEYASAVADENYGNKAGYFLGDLSNGGANEKYCFRVNGGVGTTVCEADTTLNQWVQYTGVFTGTSMSLYKFYANGTSATPVTKTFAQTAFKPDTADSTLLGLNGFKGKLDQAVVYSRALTGAEIAQLAALPPDTVAPTAPANLKVATTSNLNISGVSASRLQPSLAWDASTDDRAVAGYHVYRNGVMIQTYRSDGVLIPLVTGTNYIDTTITAADAGKTLSYQVKAVDAAGNESLPSNQITFTPQAVSAIPLTVSANGHYIQTTPTTPFLYIGDTEWILQQHSDSDILTLLDDRAAKGYTVIKLAATGITTGIAGDVRTDYYGNLPFVGTNVTQLNTAWWNHFSWIVDRAAERGLYVELTIGGPGRLDEIHATSNAQAYEYGRQVGNLFKGKKNIIFNIGQDMHASDPGGIGVAGWCAIAEGVADGTNGVNAYDPINNTADYSTTFMTFHPGGLPPYTSSGEFVGHDAWLDTNGMEVWSNNGGVYQVVNGDYNLAVTKPTLVVEGTYEQGTGYTLNGNTDTTIISAQYVRVEAWSSFFAGGAGYDYGNGLSWSNHAANIDYINSPGSVQMGILTSFMKAREWWKLVPDQAMITSGAGSGNTRVAAVKSTDGDEAYVYFPTRTTATINLNRITTSSKVTAQWLDPRGIIQDPIAAGVYTNSQTVTFTPPFGWEDAVLMLTAG